MTFSLNRLSRGCGGCLRLSDGVNGWSHVGDTTLYLRADTGALLIFIQARELIVYKFCKVDSVFRSLKGGIELFS